MSNALSQVKHRLAIGLDREQPFFEPLIADQWVIEPSSEIDPTRRSRHRAASRANLPGAKRFCDLASFHNHCVRGHWCWLRGGCCHDRSREHRRKVAETIRRRRRSCFLSGSSIGRSTKKPVCRALDHEFRSASVVGAREGEGLFQLDCGQSGRSRG